MILHNSNEGGPQAIRSRESNNILHCQIYSCQMRSRRKQILYIQLYIIKISLSSLKVAII